MEFKAWLVEHEGTSGKTGLYPLGYGGIGLYPPQCYLTRSADAIYYLSIDERIYKAKDGPPFDITHLPGKASHKSAEPGEGGIWDISKLPGKPSHLRPEPNGAKPGDGPPWSIKHLK